jgi:hypothetical protein
MVRDGRNSRNFDERLRIILQAFKTLATGLAILD